MLTIAFIMLFVIIFFGVVNRKSTFSAVLLIRFFCLIVMTIISIIYISKFSNYLSLWDFERMLYNKILKIEVHIVNLSRIYNIFIALYFFASVIFLKKFTKIRNIYLILITIPLVFFWIINSETVSMRMYYLINNEAKNLDMFLRLRKIINTSICLYSLIPSICIFCFIRKVTIKLKRKSMFKLLTSFLVMDVYGIFMLNYAPLCFVAPANLNLLKLPENVFSVSGFNIGTFIMFCVVLYAAIMIVFLRPFNYANSISSREEKRLNYIFERNMKMILHTYRNAFSMIDKMISLMEVCAHNGNFKKLDECSAISKKIVHEQLNEISRALDASRTIDGEPESITKMTDCVESAIKKINIKPDITISKRYESDGYVAINEYYFVEAVVNLIKNAIDALNTTEENRTIDFRIYDDEEFCVLDVKDNGFGIKSKDVEHVFRPYYSTKSKSSVGGIGLSFVKNVVTAYNGDVEIISKENAYTTVRVILPKLKKVKKKGAKKHE